MVLEYIDTYRLSQEKLKSHLEDVLGCTNITIYVSDACLSHADTASQDVLTIYNRSKMISMW
jgi:hypothetical protein